MMNKVSRLLWRDLSLGGAVLSLLAGMLMEQPLGYVLMFGFLSLATGFHLWRVLKPRR
jgi:hypothetical protein